MVLGAVVRSRLQGLAVWSLGVILAWTLPGALWKSAQPPAFPVHALVPSLAALGALAVMAPALAWLGGPVWASRRFLAVLEAPPELIWAALLLLLWPAGWGPPALGGWVLAFLLCALPSEVRWLAQALPPESPFPEAWGRRAVLRSRQLSLARLWGRWLAARVPLWLTAGLVLERLLGVPGLGTDWMGRIACRDRQGLAAWLLLLALLWLAALPLEREEP